MRNAHILIVDDEPEIRELHHLALLNGSRKIGEAESALSALRYIRHNPVDIVLLDIGLPGTFDGFSLCELIRNESSLAGMHVVVISGYRDDVDQSLADRYEVDQFLVKPVDSKLLAGVVAKIEYGLT